MYRFLPGIVLAAVCSICVGEQLQVENDESFRNVLRNVRAGDVVQIKPGTYRGGLSLNQSGTEAQRIVIEAADPQKPPFIQGGTHAIHASATSYVTLRNINVSGQTGNGINCDDGGKADGSAVGLILENIRVSDVGPTGNRDGIKLSGLTDFKLINCTIEGWGGSAVDMVGCHDGVIEGCTVRGKDGFEQSTGIQTKGGSRNLIIRNCVFLNGGSRAVNCGGSTGMAYFRPKNATWEAKDIIIEDCRFVGSDAPVAFVGVDGAIFRHNTIYHPARWLFRILQETTDERFARCRNVVFEHNLVVWRAGNIRSHVNISPNTSPETFQFRDNFWFCEDRPAASEPQLPAKETGGVHGRDPKLTLKDGLPSAIEDYGFRSK